MDPKSHGITQAHMFLKDRNDSIRLSLKGMIPEIESSKLRVDFYCECRDSACTERVSLLLAEYEYAHSQVRQYAVLPGHISGDDRVVERCHDHWIITG